MKTKKTLREEAIVRRTRNLIDYQNGNTPEGVRNLKPAAEKARIAERDIANTRFNLTA